MEQRQVRCEATNVRPGDLVTIRGNAYLVERVESAICDEAYVLVFTMKPVRGNNRVLAVFKHGNMVRTNIPTEESAGFSENRRILSAVTDMIRDERPAGEIIEYLADQLDAASLL